MRGLTIIVLVFITELAAASADLFIYPNMGQDPEQQRRDRYECHVWAAQQSGFDPSTYQAPQPVKYPPHARRGSGSDLNPVTGAAGGAAAGAVGGAIAGDAGKGAAIGAGVGAVLGAFHTLMRQDEQRDRREEMRERRAGQAEVRELRNDYNRAISACLEGRGYTVK